MMMKRVLVAMVAAGLLGGWYVVTYSGGIVAGPFSLMSDCQDVARLMRVKYTNVSEICQYK